MTFIIGRRLALAGAVLLAVACAPVEDVTELVEDPPPPAHVPTEVASGPDPPPTPTLAYETARVLRIVDGDTFDARLADGRTERIRPPQFDAPERSECWHNRATSLLAQLIGGRMVDLIPLSNGPDRGRHHRLLRAVEVDGEDIGAQMLEAGAARWLDGYANEDADLAAMYEAAESRARHSGAGAWTACPDWP